MLKQSVIALFLFVPVWIATAATTLAQPYSVDFSNTAYPFNQWTTATIEKANTAANTDTMSRNEKAVVFFCNLARLNGKLFAKTFLQQYIDSAGIEEDSVYVGTLFSDLKAAGSLPVFQPATDLQQIADSYARRSGQKGWTGHKYYHSRFRNAYPNYWATGENCLYETSNPLEIVLKLLIDRGVESLGHRHNILDPNFNRIGIAIAPHSELSWVCVMDFGHSPQQ